MKRITNTAARGRTVFLALLLAGAGIGLGGCTSDQNRILGELFYRGYCGYNGGGACFNNDRGRDGPSDSSDSPGLSEGA